MSYASVQEQKNQGDLAVAQERSRGATEVAGIQGDTSRYGADQTLTGTERTAEAHEYGASKSAEASMYGADRSLEGAVTPKFTYNTYQGLVKGGLALAARPYLVGEKGPELMVPDQSGTIIPNHRLQAILKRKTIPRAGGGRVDVPGIVAQNLVDYKTAGDNIVGNKKTLMRAAADIDPTGARGYQLAASLAPQRVENEAVKTDYGNQFNEFYKANTGVAAVPKVGEPDFPDYHGAYEVARRFGPQAAEAFHNDSQKIKQYKPLFTPEAVAAYHGIAPDKAVGFMDELAKNPADYRRYLLTNGPALQKKLGGGVAAPSNQTAGGQLETIGRAITPNWMRPPEWGPAPGTVPATQ